MIGKKVELSGGRTSARPRAHPCIGALTRPVLATSMHADSLDLGARPMQVKLKCRLSEEEPGYPRLAVPRLSPCAWFGCSGPRMSCGGSFHFGRRAGFAVAHRSCDSLALRDRVDPVRRRKADRFHCSRGPVDLRCSRIRGLAQSEVRTLVVRRDITARTQNILAHAE